MSPIQMFKHQKIPTGCIRTIFTQTLLCVGIYGYTSMQTFPSLFQILRFASLFYFSTFMRSLLPRFI